ncbi:MAG: phage integrase SAM-like domain-containing protein [Saprospiraceae bacterium]|nr:phage integrase SAM-like domain-containing protein [Saprospiraceae bacterium]
MKLSQVTTKWLNKYRAFLEEKNSNNAASKNISMLLTSPSRSCQRHTVGSQIIRIQGFLKAYNKRNAVKG